MEFCGDRHISLLNYSHVAPIISRANQTDGQLKSLHHRWTALPLTKFHAYTIAHCRLCVKLKFWLNRYQPWLCRPRTTNFETEGTGSGRNNVFCCLAFDDAQANGRFSIAIGKRIYLTHITDRYGSRNAGSAMVLFERLVELLIKPTAVNTLATQEIDCTLLARPWLSINDSDALPASNMWPLQWSEVHFLTAHSVITIQWGYLNDPGFTVYRYFIKMCRRLRKRQNSDHYKNSKVRVLSKSHDQN